MNTDQLWDAIRRREQYLQEIPPPQRGEFHRDLIATYGRYMANDIYEFRRDGVVNCSWVSLFGTAATAAQRKALERGLRTLEQAGRIAWAGRSKYRVMCDQVLSQNKS